MRQQGGATDAISMPNGLKKQKFIARRIDGAFLILVERAWLTEYVGFPTDSHLIGDFCLDLGSSFIASLISRAEARERFWPHTCRAVKVVSIFSAPPHNSTTIQFPAIENWRHIMHEAMNVINGGDLGKLRMTPERANELKTLIKSRWPSTFSNNNPNLVGFPQLEDEFDADGSQSDFGHAVRDAYKNTNYTQTEAGGVVTVVFERKM